MRPGPESHVRIARPSRDLSAAERFWVGGLGLEVLFRDDDVIARLTAAGGRKVTARNAYWEEHGLTIADPDGYLLVLSGRSWG